MTLVGHRSGGLEIHLPITQCDSFLEMVAMTQPATTLHGRDTIQVRPGRSPQTSNLWPAADKSVDDHQQP